ncbi:MAG TPA: endonuclease/exonuclease/phosphatase family protein [Lacipirellula sp.]
MPACQIRRRALLAIIAAVSCSAFSPSRAIGASGQEPHRILSCNIRVPLEADAAEGNGWEHRRDLCADVIAAHRGDVICLQECWLEQLTYLKDRLPEYDSYGLSNPGAEFTPINAIMYSRDRYELISAGGFWLSETPHVAGSKSWDSKGVRFTNWVHLRERDTGRELRVWNAHLDHVGQVAREEQARRLAEGMAAMDESGVPQILVGDMNAYEGHPAIAVLKAAGLHDTYEAMHGPGDPGFTYHGFLGKERKMKGRGRKIDWIFTRGEIETRAADIIRDGRDGRYPSDHYFISADIVLPE